MISNRTWVLIDCGSMAILFPLMYILQSYMFDFVVALWAFVILPLWYNYDINKYNKQAEINNAVYEALEKDYD